MSVRNAISEYRDVKIAFDDAAGQDIVDQTAQIAAPIDAFKAALEVVARMEGQYAKDNSSVSDLTDQTVLATGNLPFQIHVFTVTVDISAGDYIFVYVETVPTSDDVS
jgi:hypothetical protein